ncbi:MAG: hypothetical protein COA94_01040 [Rickettsiales bacterium]|nr:MAG: hypothetical protein COA94_01040 [Rickettsiales bacterium]
MKKYNIEPASFTAGETVTWKKWIAGFESASGWELVYLMRSQSDDSAIEFAAEIEDDHHLVTLASNETINYKTGQYWWQCFARRAGEQHLIAEGSMFVKPNFSQMDRVDGRSHVKKTLDALEAMIQGKASRDQLSYSIAGRSLSRLSPSELLQWRDQYKAEYVLTRRKSGDLNDQVIKIKFGRV